MDYLELFTQLKNRHGLYEWTVKYSKGTRIHGSCKPTLKTLTISREACRQFDLSEIRDIMLHEIAHALDVERNGLQSVMKDPHGPKWQAICREIGARPEEYSSLELKHKWEIRYNDTVIAKYYKKPKYSEGCYVKGRPETKGKLKLVKL